MKKILIILLTFILVSCSSKPVKIDENNLKEVMFDEILTKIDNEESFIYYIGYDSCAGCKEYNKTLAKFFKNNEDKLIYYVDFEDNFAKGKPYNSYAKELAHIAYTIYGKGFGFQDALYTPTTFVINNGVYRYATVGATHYEVVESLYDLKFNNIILNDISIDESVNLINGDEDFYLFILFEGNNHSIDLKIELNSMSERKNEKNINILTINESNKNDENLNVIYNFISTNLNKEYVETYPTLISRKNKEISIMDRNPSYNELVEFIK